MKYNESTLEWITFNFKESMNSGIYQMENLDWEVKEKLEVVVWP